MLSYQTVNSHTLELLKKLKVEEKHILELYLD